MKRTARVLFYVSATVAAWQALRYFHGRLLASADLSAEQSSVRDRKAYRRATERWENEGGATLAGHPSGSTHSTLITEYRKHRNTSSQIKSAPPAA